MRQNTTLAIIGLLTTLTMTSCSGPKKNDAVRTEFITGSIVGGTKVETNKFTSVVGLTMNNRIGCSANVVDKKTIITAVHCAQSSSFSSQEEATEFVGLLTEKLDEIVPGVLSMGLFDVLVKKDQRRFLKESIEGVIMDKAKLIGVHVGNGSQGQEVAGEQIVKQVLVNSAYVDLLFANLFANSPYGVEEDKLLKYDEVKDVMVLKLEEELENVTPIPLITTAEKVELLKIGTELQAVGFGLKVDRKMVEMGQEEAAKVTAQIAIEQDEEKKKELEAQLAQIQAQLMSDVMLTIQSGDKNQVTIKISALNELKIAAVSTKEQELHGACNGDSGGPIFAKLANGELRQVGVMVTVDFCGVTTNSAPITAALTGNDVLPAPAPEAEVETEVEVEEEEEVETEEEVEVETEEETETI